MSNVEVFVVVEGQTEQTFIRDVLGPAIAHQGIFLHPALIGRPGRKGGDIHFERARRDIGKFLQQRSGTYVSTMFDYSGINAEWPGLADLRRRAGSGTKLTPGQKAEELEAAMQEAIEAKYSELDARRRFVPYIEMHEFEGLLFSDIQVLAQRAEIDVSVLRGILSEHGEAEAINDNPNQSPSRRLQTLNNHYRKVAMGKSVSESIGIPTIREKCSHFDQWLIKLEGLRPRSTGNGNYNLP